MPKTYSVAIQNSKGEWITNWDKWFKLEDIDFEKVEKYCRGHGDKAYGYYYGINSNNLTSARCRTVIKELTK